MTNIIKHEKSYNLFIEGLDKPITLTEPVGKQIEDDLLKSPNGFISIGGALYNRHLIKKMELIEVKRHGKEVVDRKDLSDFDKLKLSQLGDKYMSSKIIINKPITNRTFNN